MTGRSSFWSHHLKNETIQAILILFFALVIFFSPTIFSSRINSASDILQKWPIFSFEKDYVPQNTLLSDPVVQSEPWAKFAKESLKSGQIPLWNPYQGNGTPHIANMQSAFFYPLNWLVFLFSFKTGLLLLYFLKLFFIGFFMYLYFRQIKFHHYASIIGSVAFMFCQYDVAWLYWPIVNVMFFLPLSFFLIEKILTSRKSLYIWLYAISIAVALFGGHPETFVHISFASFLYFLFRLQTLPALGKSKIKLIFDFAKAHVFGVLLAGVQIIPFYEYLTNSSAFHARTFAENPYFLPFSLAPLNFVPDLFGNPAYHNYFLKISNYNESNGGYVGLTMLFFAILSLIWLHRKKIIWFFGILAIFSLAIVYKAPFIYKIFTSLPILNKMANHRMLFLLAFSLTVLGTYFLSEIFTGMITFSKKRLIPYWTAYILAVALLCALSVRFLYPSLDDIEKHWGYIGNIALFTGADLLILLALLFLKNSKYLFAGILILVFLETGAHGLFYQPAIKAKYFFPESEAINFLKTNIGPQRVTSVSNTAYFSPNVATYFGLSDIKNYDAMLVGDYKKELDAHSTNNATFQYVKNIDKEYLDLSGVKYIIAKSENEIKGKLSLNEADLGSYPAVFLGNKFAIFENKDVLPRAFLTDPSRVQTDLLAKQDILSDENNSAQIKKYTANEIAIETSSPNISALILTDTYYPGWKAYVDGSETSIKETSSSFRAVDLTPGKHDVIFRYRPRSFSGGLFISLLSLLIIGINIFRYRPTKIRPRRER